MFVNTVESIESVQIYSQITLVEICVKRDPEIVATVSDERKRIFRSGEIDWILVKFAQEATRVPDIISIRFVVICEFTKLVFQIPTYEE